jgi:xanthine/uracil/vitamin C permease (AzgA family)
MHRIYELIKHVFKEKVNIFIKGALGGWMFSGVLLFGGNITSTRDLVATYLLKLLAVSVSGLITGFVTVLGNELAHMVKAKASKRKIVKKRQNKRAA